MSAGEIKFGVVVPFYGVEKYIEKCLDSLLKQSYKNYIVVLVDDGSKDGSRTIAERYTKRYPEQFMIVEEMNQGLGEARNFGVKNLPADVEYFMFLDSDDFIDNSLFEKVSSVLSKERYDIVAYNFREMDEDGHIFGIYNLCDNRNGPVPKDDIRKHMRFTSVAPGRIYRKEFWNEIGVEFPTRLWYEDTAIASYIFSKCQKLYLLNESFYNYVQRDGSIMNNQNLDKMMDIIKSLDYLNELFIASGSLAMYRKEIEATSAVGVVVCMNRINMYEKGSARQAELADYLFGKYPDCDKNDYLGDDFRDRLSLIKDKRFVIYFVRYSMVAKFKQTVKTIIPEKMVRYYRNKKYC